MDNLILKPITKELFEYFAGNSDRSDLHMKQGNPPYFRTNGKLEIKSIECSPENIMTSDLAKDFICDIFKMRWHEDGEAKFNEYLKHGFQEDFAIQINERVRARVNVYKSLGTINAALRQIPSEMPVLEHIGFNRPSFGGAHLEKIKQILNKKEGLVLITGQTGSGKSTTLASMVNYINSTYSKHIITIEDPVEFRHHNKKSVISHREVGADTESFFTGLRASLREDPDIILVGEMRDPETALAAMQAAQTGHIVLATLHTNSAPETLTRILDMFPPEKSKSIKVSLAQSLLMILSQKLPPTVSGKRTLAYELMYMTPQIRTSILKEEDAFDVRIADIISENTNRGMIPMARNLSDLVKNEIIDINTAIEYLTDQSEDRIMEFSQLCQKRI